MPQDRDVGRWTGVGKHPKPFHAKGILFVVPISSDVETSRARFLNLMGPRSAAMSTESSQPDVPDSTASVVADAPATPLQADSASATNAAQSSSFVQTLPPRIDAGDDLDDVLGEVSRAFGQSAGHASPMGALAEDTINDHLADLTAVERTQLAGPSAAQQQPPLETAEDLFRSLPPAEGSVDAPQEAEATAPASQSDRAQDVGDATAEQPVGDQREVEADDPTPNADSTAKGETESLETTANGAVAETANASPSTPATKVPAKVRDRSERVVELLKATFAAVRRIEQNLPKRTKFAAALLTAALVGGIAGAKLGRSTGPQVVESEVAETSSEVSAAENGDKARLAGLEEQLQKTLHERDVAQHDRDQAREKLEKSTAQQRAEEQSRTQAHARDEASRKQALEEFRQAEDRLQVAQLRAYDSQLARVRDGWQRKPGLAAALLEDPNGCPLKCRDFAWGYFYSRVKSDRATWTDAAPLAAVAWSPDGKLVASAGRNGSITLRDAVSGKPVLSLKAHAGGVNAVVFSQHGDWLASAGEDATVKLWEVPSGRLEATFFGHLGAALSVAISPDAASLVSGGDDGTVKFWDVASRRAIATRWGVPRNREPDDANDPTRFVRAVAFCPDGNLVASGGFQTVRIWDANALERTTLSIPEGNTSALAFSPDGSTLAIGTERSITLRDVDTLLFRSGPQPVDAPVSGLTFSADGAWLAAASGEGSLIFRRLPPPDSDRPQTNGRKAEPEPARYALNDPRRLLGHNGPVTGITFAPDGELLATAGVDGTIRLWNSRGGNIDKSSPDLVLRDIPRSTALAYSPDGSTLAIGTPDSIRLWNVHDGVEVARLENRSGEVTRLTFSPEGGLLAAASRDWPILIWDIRAQRIKLALNGHTAGINSLAYSADRTRLLSASADGTARFWDAGSGQPLGTVCEHAGRGLRAALSPDGKLVASAGADGTVRLWSVDGKRLLTSLAGHDRPIAALAFSPNGRFLLTAQGQGPQTTSDNQTAERRPISLWSVPAGREVVAFGPENSDLRDIVFSPDSKTLAASDPTGVTLWDPRTGEMRQSLQLLSSRTGRPQQQEGTHRPACPVAFSPDGRSLAAGDESAVLIWSAAPYASAQDEKTAAVR
jgi:WD40 repeat protein